MLKKSISTLLITTAASTGVLAAEGDALFSFDGKDYQLKQLQPWLQQSYYDAEVKARDNLNKVLEQAMIEMYIEKVATKSDRAINAVRDELFKAEPVTQQEIQKLYDQYKDQIGRPLKDVEARIRQELEGQKRQKVIMALLEKVKKETGFVSKLPMPVAPTLAMDLSPYPWKGSADAEITVVEFADYNCGYCRKSKPEIDKVIKQYGDKVKMYYVDYPVTERGVSGTTTQTARGAYCAGKQNKFWEFNDLAYNEKIAMDTAGKLAIRLKLDESAFYSCLTSDESKKFVETSTSMAQDLGVTGTPTLFINGQRLHSHDAGKDLKAEIEKRLK